MKIVAESKYLEVNLDKQSDVLSWCPYNGGRAKGKSIFWAQVDARDLNRSVKIEDYLRARWEEEGINPDFSFMTSADISDFVYKKYEHQDLKVEILVTTGLGNALRAGDPGGFHLSLGTINILIEINKPLSSSALVEAICIATEAKTAAVMEMGIKSKKSNKTATGTGTDCIAIAAREKLNFENEYIYSGKHTKLGELIGGVCFDAVTVGIKKWLKKNRKLNEVDISYRRCELR